MKLVLPNLATPALTGQMFHREWLAYLRALGDLAKIPVGRLPFAYQAAFSPAALLTASISLAANGGSIAIPMLLQAPLNLISVSVYNTDINTARTWRWDLYQDNVDETLRRVASPTAAATFTPTAASTRTLAASAVKVLDPGLYWLVIQNTHATSAFGLGATVPSTAFELSSAQTKTTTNPNGATLDFTAATWTKVKALYAARLNGGVFGEDTAF